MAFAQYIRHPESKSLAPDGTRCNGYTCGLLGRYPVTASGFYLIGKETERGWEQSEDISTLLPSLMRYQKSCVAGEQLRQRLVRIPLVVLERETGLSRHSIIRVRTGKKVHPHTLRVLTRTALLGCANKLMQGNLVAATNQPEGSSVPARTEGSDDTRFCHGCL